GKAHFDTHKFISDFVGGATCARTGDLDGDGDLDVVSAASFDGVIFWHQNLDGHGTFDIERKISDSVHTPMSIDVKDLDGDGDLDVVSASSSDGKIAWYENLDGKGNFGPQKILSNTLNSTRNVIATDIDDDGDMDVFAAAYGDHQILWFDNEDGHGNFSVKKLVASSIDFPSSIFAADFDGDGDQDLAFTDGNFNYVEWCKNYTLKVLVQPQSQASCNEQAVSFYTMAKDYTGFHWQEDDGTGFKDLFNNSNYWGTATNVLHIVLADSSMSGYKYRCQIFNSQFNLFTEEATLTILDHQPPAIISIPGNQTVKANASCSSILPDYTHSISVTDNCDNAPEVHQIPQPGTVISGSLNTVSIMATDHSGNSSSISFNVEVADTIVPVILTSPGNQIVSPTLQCSAVLADFTHSVSASDNCDTSLYFSQNPTPGTMIQGTNNLVFLTVTDHSNNSASMGFNVEVKDSIAPVIRCKNDTIIQLKNSEDVYIVQGSEFDPVYKRDNCQIDFVTNDLNHNNTLNGQHLSIGTTTITWKIADNSNNQSECRFTLTIKSGKRSLLIYPSPTSGPLYFEFDRDDIQKIVLFDAAGKPLLEKTVTRQKEQMNLVNLPDGIYFVRIITSQDVIIRKVVKMEH
ncbi:MAG: FG-GAP-like repeat-containing protein, partial [Bacteroidota bacterium]